MSTLALNKPPKGELAQNGGTIIVAIILAPVIVLLLVLLFSVIMKPLTLNAYQERALEQLLTIETQRVSNPTETIEGYSFPVKAGSEFILPTIAPMDTLPTVDEVVESLKHN